MLHLLGEAIGVMPLDPAIETAGARAVTVVNLLLGWTLIGWVAALVMACTAEPAPSDTVVIAQPGQIGSLPSAGWYPSPTGAGQQYWDGTAWTDHRAP